MNAKSVCCWLGIAIVFLWFILPWLILFVFVLLAILGIIPMVEVTSIIDIIRAVVLI